MRPLVLGIAASLRNARWGFGNSRLIDDLKAASSPEELKTYLTRQADLHLQNFVDSGRKEGLDFLQIYGNLKKREGDEGLSNSEVALAAALWSAHRAGCDIDHLSLSQFYTASGSSSRHLPELKRKIAEADAIMVSGPVYFGDRGSLAQELVDLIRNSSGGLTNIENKVYGGISVGAKRNGGQETTLIYQLLDMIHCGLLGVGNDAETTSQYGGTGHAGDVGTMPKDQYGLETSMGTGRRVAHVATLLGFSREVVLRDKLRVMFWILQDADGKAAQYLNRLLSDFPDEIQPTIIHANAGEVARCLACDICPTHVERDEEYRCIIKKRADGFVNWHESFLGQDAVVPVAFSPTDRAGVVSNYQTFIERTRYLRRGDYVFSDLLTAPLVLEEPGAHENLAVRMVTSMIRHHTVMAEPMIAYQWNNDVLNHEQVSGQFRRFIDRGRLLAAGRLYGVIQADGLSPSKYNPVGYILSQAKDAEDEKRKLRERPVALRYEAMLANAQARLMFRQRSAAA